MTVLVAAVLDRTKILLNDPSEVRWPEAERLKWVVDAAREVLIHKPEAGCVTTAITLAAGDTKQALPAGYLRMLDVIRNVTGGAPVTTIDRHQMDLRMPNWHASPAKAAIRHAMVDAANPRVFWVWPKLTAQAQVEATLVAEIPATVTNTAELALDSIYTSAVIDYVLFRAFTKDAEDAFNGERALAHYQAFAGAVGLTIKHLPKMPTPGAQ